MAFFLVIQHGPQNSDFSLPKRNKTKAEVIADEPGARGSPSTSPSAMRKTQAALLTAAGLVIFPSRLLVKNED